MAFFNQVLPRWRKRQILGLAYSRAFQGPHWLLCIPRITVPAIEDSSIHLMII